MAEALLDLLRDLVADRHQLPGERSKDLWEEVVLIAKVNELRRLFDSLLLLLLEWWKNLHALGQQASILRMAWNDSTEADAATKRLFKLCVQPHKCSKSNHRAL